MHAPLQGDLNILQHVTMGLAVKVEMSVFMALVSVAAFSPCSTKALHMCCELPSRSKSFTSCSRDGLHTYLPPSAVEEFVSVGRELACYF